METLVYMNTLRIPDGLFILHSMILLGLQLVH
jgi:hypothetical protein